MVISVPVAFLKAPPGYLIASNKKLYNYPHRRIFLMANETSEATKKQLEEVADNAGARTAATNANPEIGLEEAKNAAAGEGPNASGSTAPSTAEWHIPSTSDQYASQMPSANSPNPEQADSTEEALSGSTNQDQ
jgi:imidazolonepropionase-like amidohydrolase